MKYIIISLFYLFSNLAVAQEVQVFGLGNHESKEIKCLAKNIYYEAGNEDFTGKLAVAQVTANRVNDGRFPTSFCGVVGQKGLINGKHVCQFSWYCTSKRTEDPPNNQKYQESTEVARKVIKGELKFWYLKEALYFHSSTTNPQWGKVKVDAIGNHIFYKDYKK